MRILSSLVAGLTIGTLLAGSVVRADDDDLKISPKKPAAAAAPKSKTAVAAGTKSDAPAKGAKPTTAPSGGREPQVIRLKLAEGADLARPGANILPRIPRSNRPTCTRRASL